MVYTEFGKYLRKVMLNHKEKVPDMANRLKLKPEQLIGIESGHNRVTKKLLYDIIKEYKFNDNQAKDFLNEFLQETEEYKKPNSNDIYKSKLTQSDILAIVNKTYNLNLKINEVSIELGELQQISELYAPYIVYKVVNNCLPSFMNISEYDNYTLYVVIQKFGSDDIACKRGHFKPDDVSITVYRYSLTGKKEYKF